MWGTVGDRVSTLLYGGFEMRTDDRKQIWCKKEKVACLCAGCSENKTEFQKGKCDGCADCGTGTKKPCLLI